MYNSKLIQLLQTLSKVELNRFSDYVSSPYFNKNEQIIKLLEVLTELYPKYDEENVHREVLYKKVFNDDHLNEQKLRYLMSDLTKLLENFLIDQKMKDQLFQNNHLLISIFQEKALEKYENAILDQSITYLQKYPYLDDNYYYTKYIIEKDKYQYLTSNREAAAKENLLNIVENLDIFYLINKLKYSCEIINHINSYAGEYDPMLLNEILVYLKKTKHEHIPAVAIYNQILMMLIENDNEAAYNNLKNLLIENINNIPQDEMNDMYIFARNFCAKRINMGDTKYLQELFSLYNTLIENGIIFQNGFLSQWDYKNIVVVGLELNETEWVKDFIYKYKDFIREENKENVFKFNLALYYFHLKKYGKTMDLIRDVEFTDVYYYLNCKFILLKSFYELEEIGPMYSLVDTLYNYLRRNKQVSKYQKEVRFNFLKYIKKLIKVMYRDKDMLRKLKEEISEAKHVYNHTWLLQKIDERI